MAATLKSSNSVSSSPASSAIFIYLSKSSQVIGTLFIFIRSQYENRCGLVKSPTFTELFKKCVHKISFNMAQTEPLPFVPATWIKLI